MGDELEESCHIPAAFVLFSPSRGPVGTKVSVTGGYFSSDPVSIIFDGKEVATTITGSNGSFGASFDVPDLPEGSYRMGIVNHMMASFDICPALCLDLEAEQEKHVRQCMVDHLLALQVLAKGLDPARRVKVDSALTAILTEIYVSRLSAADGPIVGPGAETR